MFNNQKELFEYIIDEAISNNSNYSIISGRVINKEQAGAYCFAHGFPKGKYPELKLNKNNIFLVSSIKEHNEFDSLFKKYKDFVGGKFLYNQILNGLDVTDSLSDFIINNK